MALIDVSRLITDPLFSDAFTLIKRPSILSQYGENVALPETSTDVIGVVQNINGETLDRTDDYAQFQNGITVYFRGQLEAESANGYCDVIVFKTERFLVKNVNNQFLNWGSGWTAAICAKEVANVK